MKFLLVSLFLLTTSSCSLYEWTYMKCEVTGGYEDSIDVMSRTYYIQYKPTKLGLRLGDLISNSTITEFSPAGRAVAGYERWETLKEDREQIFSYQILKFHEGYKLIEITDTSPGNEIYTGTCEVTAKKALFSSVEHL